MIDNPYNTTTLASFDYITKWASSLWHCYATLRLAVLPRSVPQRSSGWHSSGEGAKLNGEYPQLSVRCSACLACLQKTKTLTLTQTQSHHSSPHCDGQVFARSVGSLVYHKMTLSEGMGVCACACVCVRVRVCVRLYMRLLNSAWFAKDMVWSRTWPVHALTCVSRVSTCRFAQRTQHQALSQHAHKWNKTSCVWESIQTTAFSFWHFEICKHTRCSIKRAVSRQSFSSCNLWRMCTSCSPPSFGIRNKRLTSNCRFCVQHIQFLSSKQVRQFWNEALTLLQRLTFS